MTISEDLNDEDFNKIIGQFRLQLNGLMFPLRLYGQAVYVDMVIPQLETLALQMHLKLNGIDIPYEVEQPHW